MSAGIAVPASGFRFRNRGKALNPKTSQQSRIILQAVSRIDDVRQGLRLAMGAVMALAVVALSSSLAARAAAVAAIGVMYAVHEKLAVFRERFFKAEKLPDEA